MIENVDGFDFQTSPYLQSLRDSFKQGQKPDACNRCWSAESVGHKSRRQSAIEFYQTEFGDNTVVLESLDHSVTWACNLACVMCGPQSSSTWAAELSMTKPALAKIGKKYQKKNNFFEQIDFGNLKKLHFNGGEPLINNDHIDWLEKLDAQGILSDVFISYNTNASIYPSAKLIDLWKRTRLVKLFFSIDATEQAFEYVRWPAKWSAVEQNMLTMKKELPSNVMFGINTTVGTYNVFEVKAVKQWADQNLSCNRDGDTCDFNWQIAYNFDPKWLRKTAKQAAISHLDGTMDDIAVYLTSCIEHPVSALWIESLDRIDHRRGTKWKEQLMIGNYY